jgi:hypothetical protein
MAKKRSWGRRVLQHGLLGDGAGVRGNPDEVLDVRERAPASHVCTNQEIRATDSRRSKHLNNPTSDAWRGPPHPRPSVLISRPRRHRPRSRPAQLHSARRWLKIRFKKRSPVPVERAQRSVKRTRRRRRRRRRIGRPVGPAETRRRCLSLTDGGAPGERGA